MQSIFRSTLNTRAIIKHSYRFIRSDVPDRLTADELAFLTDNNITTAVDLRTADETVKRPCVLAYAEGFRYINLAVTGGNVVPDSPDDVSRSYVAMVDSQMQKIIETIETADTNVIYFCNAGKDRTGVVSAILLKRLGASDEEIIADYLESAENLADMLRGFAESNPEADIEVITPQRRYIAEFLEKIREGDINET